MVFYDANDHHQQICHGNWYLRVNLRRPRWSDEGQNSQDSFETELIGLGRRHEKTFILG